MSRAVITVAKIVTSDADCNSIDRVTRRDNGLEISWSDQSTSFFHFIWLRDCCYCAECGDSYSSKRHIVPSDIPADIHVENMAFDNDALTVSWSGDGHVSRYTGEWLRRNRYDEQSLKERFHQPVLWSSDLNIDTLRITFADACNTDEGRMRLFRTLRDYGLAIVTEGDCEPGSVKHVAGLIGELADSAYTPIFDLSPKSKVRTFGNTMKPVPPHTDEAFRYGPPGVNVLGCVRPADDGGDSLFVDGFAIANKLKRSNPDAFRQLCQHAQTFHRSHESDTGKLVDQRTRQPMISLDDRGEVIGIRVHTRAAGPLFMPADNVESYYAAHSAFSRLMMSTDRQFSYRLKAGESALFDNHRVLHARSDFTDPYRHLQICNVTRETFHEQLRLLAKQLGHTSEADMILPSGAGF